jgi:hypothetical protein
MVQRAHAERCEPPPLDSSREREVEREGVAHIRLLDSERGHHRNRVRVDPAQREGERVRRRAIEPLLVVDREHDRRLAREDAQAGQQRAGDGAWARRLVAGARAQQRHVERAALRIGEKRQGPIRDRAHEIGQRCECELRLGLHGPAREQRDAAFRGSLEHLPPDRGLADAGLALEDERYGSGGRELEEAVDRRQLLGARDDAELPRLVGTRGR